MTTTVNRTAHATAPADGTAPADVPDPVAARQEATAEAVFGAALGFVELVMVSLGRTLGLYAAMRRRDPGTAADVARRAGLDERYVREWLEQQTLAGILVTADPGAPAAERRFSLPPGAATALLDEECPAYVGALADVPEIAARTLGEVAGAFRTGRGIPFARYGVQAMQAGFTRARFATALVGQWLPALPDVQARLDAGEALRVCDVGSGEGWAAVYLAQAYPAVTVDGFDPDDASVAAARRHASERGVSDRVRFEVRDVLASGPPSRPYDLVLATEVVHDLADPVGGLRAMRALAGIGRSDAGGDDAVDAPAGAVLVVDERADETFQVNGDPLQRLLYGFSVLHCLPVGRDAQPSAATGALMRPATLARHAEQAGFGSVEVLGVDDPMFRLYRLRG